MTGTAAPGVRVGRMFILSKDCHGGDFVDLVLVTP